MTIGFNHLGRHGRLGNQMFQYAGLRGIAAHKGYDFAIPPSDFNDEWNDHQLFEAFKLTGLTNIEEIYIDIFHTMNFFIYYCLFIFLHFFIIRTF